MVRTKLSSQAPQHLLLDMLPLNKAQEARPMGAGGIPDGARCARYRQPWSGDLLQQVFTPATEFAGERCRHAFA